MRKTIYLFFFVLGIALNGMAQDLWPHENAEWWAEVEYYLFNPSVMHHYVNGDTLIEGEICTKIKSDHYWSYDPESTDLNIHASSERYVYFNGDTLFWLVEDEFYPLLCFNLEVGDSWYPLPQEGIEEECNQEPVSIIEKDTVFYNDQPYRRIRIEYFDWEDQPSFYWGGVFDERTFWKNYTYPHYNICGGVAEWLLYDFRCYNDAEISINDSGEPCNAPLSVYSISKPSFKVFPNPIRSGEILTMIKVDRASIYTLDGVFVDEIEISGTRIEKTNIVLPRGIYLLKLQEGNTVAIQRLVVI